MYKLHSPAVYAHASVLSEPRYRSRVERVVAGLGSSVDIQAFSDEDLADLISRQRILAGRVPMGTLDEIPDPALMFNTFRFDDRRGELPASLQNRTDPIAPALLGYNFDGRRPEGEPASAAVWRQVPLPLRGYGAFAWCKGGFGDAVCRPCWRLHMQWGCAHKCHYCHLGSLLVAMVNVEDYIEHLDRLMRIHPWQETFLLEDDADVLGLEPELGCLGPLIEHFGTLSGKYLVIHTKSANVDWMLDLKHNGNTIVVWSVAGRTQEARYEPGTGTWIERFQAAQRAEVAGYTVRYKFKPIIPTVNWQSDAAEAIKIAFELTRPDMISLCVMSWMDIAEVTRRLDPVWLDPDCLARAVKAGRTLADAQGARPWSYPPDIRAEIYDFYLREIRRHDPNCPVALSTETSDLWQEFGPRLGFGTGDYVCGCGPNSTPGCARLKKDAFAIAAEGPKGGFEKL